MAEEKDDASKTEDPSQKRLDEAHQKGNVANSREVAHWMMMFSIVMGVVMFAPGPRTRSPWIRSASRHGWRAS
jgi:flagellar biosynthesis protein FlhB